MYLIKKLDKAKEGIDDLKFQVVQSSCVLLVNRFQTSISIEIKKGNALIFINYIFF